MKLAGIVTSLLMLSQAYSPTGQLNPDFQGTPLISENLLADKDSDETKSIAVRNCVTEIIDTISEWIRQLPRADSGYGPHFLPPATSRRLLRRSQIT